VTEQPEVRVGLLGFGLAGRLLHAPFISVIPGLKLSAVVTSRVEQVHAEYPDAEVFSDVDHVISREDIDLIVVTTPHKFHVEHSLAALDAGKHVVVEKPITNSYDEIVRLITAAREKERLLIPYHQRRFDGGFRTVQQIVKSGMLGRIHYFESHWIMYRPQPRGVWREQEAELGGIFYDLAPHLIDHTLQLFGRPQTVYAQIDINRPEVNVDDLWRLNLHYEDGLHVLLETDNLAPHPVPRYVVRGLNGAFYKSGLDPQEAHLRAGLRPTVDGTWGEDNVENWGTMYLRVGDSLHSESKIETLPGDHRIYWQAVYDAIAKGSAPPVDPNDVLPQLRIMDAARKSAASHSVETIVY